jgi:hypothetical protein
MKFGQLLAALCLVLLLSAPGQAADYVVSPAGNDANSGNSQAPWRTIAKANAMARAGDTITIRGGEYTEAINPQRSGTALEPITYVAHAGEVVTLTSPPKDPRGKMTAILLTNISYIIVDGITVDGKRLSVSGHESDVDSFLQMSNSHHNVIKNCNFRYANGWSGVHIHGGSSQNRILNNSFDAVGTNHIPDGYPNAGNDLGDTLVVKNASHNVIEGNSFSRGGHNNLDIIGSYNVIRGNSVDGKWTGTDSPGARAGGELSGNAKFNVPEPRGYNLFEFNIVKNAGASVDNPANRGMKVQGLNQIVRANYFFDIKGAAIGASTRAGSIERVQHNRIYNNTIYRSGGLFVYRDYGNDFPFNDNVWKNNLVAGLQHSRQVVINFRSPANINGDTSDEIEDTTIAGNIFETGPGGDAAVLAVKVGGTLISNTFQAMGKRYPRNVYDNRTARIEFRNAAARTIGGFDVRPGSAAIDAGIPLTYTVSAGSGRTVRVEDARYFYDGFGIIGESGDSIIIGNGQATRIIAVDYDRNELTLDSSIAWSAGFPVNLAYAGNGPDVGAHELSSDANIDSQSKKPLPPLLLAD